MTNYFRGVEITGGQQTRFWHDSWLGDCHLKISFHRWFQIYTHPYIEVAQANVNNGQWVISFRRQLNEAPREEWDELQELLSDVILSEGKDAVY